MAESEEEKEGGEGREKHSDHSVAIWGGFTAFFTQLIAIKLVHGVGTNTFTGAASALFTAFCVAAAVYARQRYTDARLDQRIRDEHQRDRGPIEPPSPPMLP